jgi:hypothetical protein
MSQSKQLVVSRIKGANLIWKYADQKVNVFGPAHIEKSLFKGVFGNMTFPVVICRTKVIFNTKERNCIHSLYLYFVMSIIMIVLGSYMYNVHVFIFE